MLNGLDLFSGIGGISLALADWVRPIAYCENDRYATGVLLSRMSEGKLPIAPIWDDVRTLDARSFSHGEIDIIYGGFPCQDISVAGNGIGLGGERSGLFNHIARLVKETNPKFVFLENVPAIRTRGLNVVAQTFTELGYDCRWTIVSAQEVGAPHLRKRWFMLAHAMCDGRRLQSGGSSRKGRDNSTEFSNDGKKEPVANTNGKRLEGQRRSEPAYTEFVRRSEKDNTFGKSWWAIEPDVGRVANGVSNRAHRIKGLGNAVVPLQAQTAYKRLMGV